MRHPSRVNLKALRSGLPRDASGGRPSHQAIQFPLQVRLRNSGVPRQAVAIRHATQMQEGRPVQAALLHFEIALQGQKLIFSAICTVRGAF